MINRRIRPARQKRAEAGSPFLMAATFTWVVLAACAPVSAGEEPVIGDAPALKVHTSQEDINSGVLSVEEIIERGEALFTVSFNTLDGAGRPETADIFRSNNNTLVNTRPRQDFPHNFNRVSGPDANTCVACHNVPRAGGGGDNANNIFALADRLPNVNFDGGPGDGVDAVTLGTAGLERNSVGLFGAGWIELLAREMTKDLQDIVEDAINEAKDLGSDVSRDLVTKGVSFGRVTAHRDATLDTSEFEGIDDDLVVRPFQQKGVVVSLREFGVKAMNAHFGMQSLENFRKGVDVDRDGVVDELTIGDITALVVFQATLPTPGQVMPSSPEALAAVERGKGLFASSGCTTCHTPELRVNNPVFTEPGPFNPGGKLQATDVSNPFAVDLTTAGPGPHLKREPDGSVLVPVFTDLKRHKMGDALDTDELIQDGVPTDEFLTRKLWGFASEPPFLHHGRALLISEAILAHGGEAQEAREAFAELPESDQDAVVEFLKTMQVLPEDSPGLMMSEDSVMKMMEGERTPDNRALWVLAGSVIGVLVLLIGAGGAYVLVRNRGPV